MSKAFFQVFKQIPEVLSVKNNKQFTLIKCIYLVCQVSFAMLTFVSRVSKIFFPLTPEMLVCIDIGYSF